jgi:hypothetical protein
MVLFLYILLLSLEIVLFCRLDKLFYKTYLTPFIVLSVPFLIVTLLAYSIGPFFGFYPLSYKVVMIWIIYLFLFWVFGSFLFIATLGKSVIRKRPFNPLPEKYSLRNLLYQSSWLIIFIIVLKLVVTIKKFKGFYIWHDDFSNYFNSGLSGHLLTFAILLLIYFAIVIRKGEKGMLLIIVSILFLLFIYQVKTWIFIPAFAVIFYYFIEKRFFIKPKNLILIVLSAYIIFLLVYYPASGFSSKYFVVSYTYTFIFKHILFYLFSGVLALSQNIIKGIKTNVDPTLVISPFINLYNYFISHHHMHPIVSEFFYFIDIEKKDHSNVATFFGTLIIYSGFFWTGIYTILISTSMYFLLIINTVYRNIWLLIMYLFLLAGLAMGWMNFYFNNLNFIEIPFYCFALALLSELRYSKGR